MTDEQKADYISNIKYFWYEKGDIERFSYYSPQKLQEADPAIAHAYEQYKFAAEIFNRVLGGLYD